MLDMPADSAGIIKRWAADLTSRSLRMGDRRGTLVVAADFMFSSLEQRRGWVEKMCGCVQARRGP